jgi:hypothetical protein
MPRSKKQPNPTFGGYISSHDGSNVRLAVENQQFINGIEEDRGERQSRFPPLLCFGVSPKMKTVSERSSIL